jgi:hypothetical protein
MVPLQRSGGSGYQITELGAKILRLIQHHFKPMFERMQGGAD